MEGLLLGVVVIGLISLILGLAMFGRLWSTLGEHRRAMNALHQHLARQTIRSNYEHLGGTVPPQEGRR